MTIQLPRIKDLAPMAPKKTKDERRQMSKEKIIKVSIELFKEHGYEKTTTRQIVQRAGILNGSLYNVFESKEDIFREIIIQSYDAALDESIKVLTNGEDIVTVLSFPLALELYVASINKSSADLLHAAHASWRITNELVNRTERWVSVYLEKYNIKMDSSTVKTNLLALFGVLGNFVARYNNGEGTGYKDEIRIGLELFCTLFRIPAYNLDGVIDNILTIIENNEITIGDFKIA